MWNGLIELPVWGYIIIALALTHVTIVSVTVYLHRHQAHRGLDLHPVVAHFFRFWLWLTTGMITGEWVAVHRKHHARCETEEDPHSPQVVGLNRVLWRGVGLYRRAVANRDTVAKYAHGTPKDWLERNVYARHNGLGIVLMLGIDLLLFGLAGALIWLVQMAWIPFWAAGVINGVGHYWGYRNYEPADASTNISPVGLLIGGEELHNNHHAFPSSAKFSSKAWEFDVGWAYIRLLEGAGLARVKRVAPTPVITRPKPEVDQDTVSAVIANRLHVMASYARDVIRPTLQEEQHVVGHSRRLLRRALQLLAREETLIAPHERERLDDVLSASERLQVVYEFRRSLQAVWARSATTHDALCRALQNWCAQAEASGNQALRDFSHRLRGYTLQS